MMVARKADVNDFDAIADVYDELVAWAPYERWIARLDSHMRRLGLRSGGWLLDVACGTGLSSVPWARRGYHVIGADVSEPMLEVARRRAAKAGLDLEFVRQAVADLRPERKFDAALCLHSGLDYILETVDLRRAFRAIRRCLKPGGVFAFDKCLDVPSFYNEDYSEERPLSCGAVRFEYRWDSERRLFEQQCTVQRTADSPGPPRTEVTFHLRATPPDELAEMLDEAGFEELKPVGNFTALDPAAGIYRAV